LALQLIDWFAENARDLPWRQTRDPYAIWVSEIMLQQTQVNTVVPYYNRWMKALPDIASLSSATSQRLHRLWEGLGYYSRVRNMQEAARLICRLHEGRFPTEWAQVLALPGVGRYTAGAICSIAFGQPTPVLDGNVIRVVTRVFGISGNPREKPTNELLWQIAQGLVSAAKHGSNPIPSGDHPFPTPPASALNQALMELGAVVCAPTRPRCGACPIRRSCVARREGTIDQLPAVPTRPLTIRKHVQAFVIGEGDRFLLVPREEGDTRDGLWEFPSVEVRNSNQEPVSCVRGVPLADPDQLLQIKHAITRYQITMTVYRARRVRKTPGKLMGGRWVTRAELRRLPLSAAHRRIADTLVRE
jgi:A/G-specific adenine glycosylase